MKADVNEHIAFPGKLAASASDGQVIINVTITGSQEPIAGDPGAWVEAEEEGEAMLRVLVEETGDCLGCVSITESALLSDLRHKINDELDGVPEFFVFVSDEVPVGVKQEARRTATNYLPAICIRPLPSAPRRLSSLSSSPMAHLSPHLYQHSAGQIHGFNPPMQQTPLYHYALSPPQRGFTPPSSPQVWGRLPVGRSEPVAISARAMQRSPSPYTSLGSSPNHKPTHYSSIGSSPIRHHSPAGPQAIPKRGVGFHPPAHSHSRSPSRSPLVGPKHPSSWHSHSALRRAQPLFRSYSRDSNTLRSHEEKQYGGEASSDAGSEGDAAVRGPDEGSVRGGSKEGSVRPSPVLPGVDKLEEYAGPTFGFFDEDLAVWDYGVAEEVRADYREDVLPPPLKLGASQFGHRSLFGDQAYGGGAQEEEQELVESVESVESVGLDERRRWGGVVTPLRRRSTRGMDEQTGQNRICVLFSMPLAYLGRDGALRPMVTLDLEQERALILKSLQEAAKDIEVVFDFATTDSLRTMLTLGCRVLHYSGHANDSLLSFEDGFGGTHFVKASQLKSLFVAGSGGRGKPDLCVVSACSSRSAGEAFLQAGVTHVVAVESRTDLLDRASAQFTRAFYLALFEGMTVRASFDIGREAVKASPNVSPSEADKFLLLPEDAAHDVALFDGVAGADFPPQPFHMSADHLPAPPEGFLGRSVEMYQVVTKTLRHRLVSLCGPAGVGKTAVAIAVANYISERRHARSRDGVFYLSLSRARSLGDVLLELARELDIPDASENGVVMALQRCSCLLVWDAPKLEDEAVRGLLARLLSDTRETRILVTSHQPVLSFFGGSGSTEHCAALFGAGEKVVQLDALRPFEAARLLLQRSPRSIKLAELGANTQDDMMATLATHPIMQTLGGMPGAIVSIAPQLQTLQVNDLAEKLHRNQFQTAPKARAALASLQTYASLYLDRPHVQPTNP